MQNTPFIELEGVSRSFGSQRVIDRIHLKLEKGLNYAIVGESGSGKTTCLKLMNGLIPSDEGEIRIKGKKFDYSRGDEIRRSMGYSQQGSGLFPHFTVLENISIIAKKEAWSEEKIKNRAREILDTVQLKYEEVVNKFPRQLSGGQRQRVGIARALFLKPEVMIMDEPFGALDPNTRSEMQDLIVRLKKKDNFTAVIVTHDLSEAFRLADKVILINKGKVEQIGSPNQLLARPSSKYVSEFLQSHSPGNVLKDIKLYAVMNSDIFTLQEMPAKVVGRNIMTNETLEFSNKEEALQFLAKNKQKDIFKVNNENKLIEINGVEINSSTVDSILSEENLLLGIQKLFATSEDFVTVRNAQGQLVGCLDRQVLDDL